MSSLNNLESKRFYFYFLQDPKCRRHLKVCRWTLFKKTASAVQRLQRRRRWMPKQQAMISNDTLITRAIQLHRKCSSVYILISTIGSFKNLMILDPSAPSFLPWKNFCRWKKGEDRTCQPVSNDNVVVIPKNSISLNKSRMILMLI